ncbi:ABC transporter ATP-binding protein [Martelella soudanensis]|uniref:ABC transporter ATP-binding protein n=1 Tax=unclassified Martelella TaxID=2629616 RepID=UPI0015DF307D|nr:MULTISPECIES: ATP-binding cassette domain-containing protein [unclassified Martelella]
MPSVEIRNLNKHYGPFHALKDINLSLNEGEFVVMVGPSGCGKSTLLRTIAGLEDATTGQIFVNGREVTQVAPRDRGLAMVFQNYALYPHLTVAENMGFALRLARRPKPEINAAVGRAAEILQLTELLDKKPRHLSGGQRQRVAIGRAIVREPDVFLFDEPLSNLDAALRAQMRVELSALHQSLGASMIYVTHDQVEAMTMASRIVLLRGGIIEQVGEPLELYNRPANRFVAGFLGAPKMNFFAGTISAVSETMTTITVAGGISFDLPNSGFAADTGLKAADTVSFGIRPEDFLIADEEPNSAGPAFDVNIALEERLGRETVLYADGKQLRPDEIEQPHITIHRNVQSGFRPGDSARVAFNPNVATVFAADGRAIRWPSVARH